MLPVNRAPRDVRREAYAEAQKAIEKRADELEREAVQLPLATELRRIAGVMRGAVAALDDTSSPDRLPPDEKPKPSA